MIAREVGKINKVDLRKNIRNRSECLEMKENSCDLAFERIPEDSYAEATC